MPTRRHKQTQIQRPAPIKKTENSTFKTFKLIIGAFFLFLTGYALFRALFEGKATASHGTIKNDVQLRPTLLNNPYSDERFCGREPILPAKLSECAYVEKEFFNPADPASTFDRYCVRKMTEPSMNCFYQAVDQGAEALIKNDLREFKNIRSAWPAHYRNTFNELAIQEYNRRMSVVNPQKPKLDPHSSITNDQYERVPSEPFRRDKLKM